MKTVKTIKASENETRLEKRVRCIMNRYASEYDSGVAGFMEDLMYGGCASGMVSELIYYRDTVRFFNSYKKEINALIRTLTEECGLKLSELKGWDDSDPLVMDDYNKNLLAWLAFEEIARLLAEKNGIEV